MRASPKITNRESSPQIFVGIVESVNYTDLNPNNLYSIRFKWVGEKTHGYGDTETARPIDPGITQPPLIGELVLMVACPNSNSTSLKEWLDFYYISTLNIQNEVSSNQKPDSAQVTRTVNNKYTAKNYNEISQTSIPRKSDQGKDSLTQKNGKAILGKNYTERDNSNRVSPLQSYEGDRIIQGRFGNSIRLGSSFSDLSEFSVPPTWKKSQEGDDGQANILISCGRKPGIPTNANEFNNFTVEDPNADASMIWLMEGQIISGLEPSVKRTPAMNDEKIDTWKEQFGGDQVFISTGRLIFNTRKDEIVMFSEGGVGISSNNSITLDTQKNIRMYAEDSIYIGASDKSEPAVRGEKNAKVLEDLQSQLNALTQQVIELNKAVSKFSIAFTSTWTAGSSTVPIVAPIGGPLAGTGGILTSDIFKISTKVLQIKTKVGMIKNQINPTKSRSVYVK